MKDFKNENEYGNMKTGKDIYDGVILKNCNEGYRYYSASISTSGSTSSLSSTLQAGNSYSCSHCLDTGWIGAEECSYCDAMENDAAVTVYGEYSETVSGMAAMIMSASASGAESIHIELYNSNGNVFTSAENYRNSMNASCTVSPGMKYRIRAVATYYNGTKRANNYILTIDPIIYVNYSYIKTETAYDVNVLANCIGADNISATLISENASYGSHSASSYQLEYTEQGVDSGTCNLYVTASKNGSEYARKTVPIYIADLQYAIFSNGTSSYGVHARISMKTNSGIELGLKMNNAALYSGMGSVNISEVSYDEEFTLRAYIQGEERLVETVQISQDPSSITVHISEALNDRGKRVVYMSNGNERIPFRAYERNFGDIYDYDETGVSLESSAVAQTNEKELPNGVYTFNGASSRNASRATVWFKEAELTECNLNIGVGNYYNYSEVMSGDVTSNMDGTIIKNEEIRFPEYIRWRLERGEGAHYYAHAKIGNYQCASGTVDVHDEKMVIPKNRNAYVALTLNTGGRNLAQCDIGVGFMSDINRWTLATWSKDFKHLKNVEGKSFNYTNPFVVCSWSGSTVCSAMTTGGWDWETIDESKPGIIKTDITSNVVFDGLVDIKINTYSTTSSDNKSYQQLGFESAEEFDVVKNAIENCRDDNGNRLIPDLFGGEFHEYVIGRVSDKPTNKAIIIYASRYNGTFFSGETRFVRFMSLVPKGTDVADCSYLKALFTDLKLGTFDNDNSTWSYTNWTNTLVDYAWTAQAKNIPAIRIGECEIKRGNNDVVSGPENSDYIYISHEYPYTNM